MFNLIGRTSSKAHFRVFKDRYERNLSERDELLRHVATQLRAFSHDANMASDSFIAELREKFEEDDVLEAFLENLEGRFPKQVAKELSSQLLESAGRTKKIMGETPFFFGNNFVAAYLQMVGQSPSLVNFTKGIPGGGDPKSHVILQEIRDYIMKIFDDRKDYLLSDSVLDDVRLQALKAGLV
jgi:hypothetical protein